MAWKYNNPAPFDVHAEMGARIKDALAAITSLLGYARYMRSKDVTRLTASARRLEELRERLEEKMYAECGIMPADACEVYYSGNEAGHVAG